MPTIIQLVSDGLANGSSRAQRRLLPIILYQERIYPQGILDSPKTGKTGSLNLSATDNFRLDNSSL